MAKRPVFVHVGLPGAGDVIEPALVTHRDRLAALGVYSPAEQQDEMFRAAIEIRRIHKEWGFRRREVEGSWANVYRRIDAGRGKDPVVLAQPLLATATAEQIDLFADGLAGLAVHIVITGAPDSVRTRATLDTWSRAVRKPERLHLLESDDATDPADLWRRFGRLVGFGTSSLAVEPLFRKHPSTLDAALAELERLERRNACLERDLVVLDPRRAKKRRKLKKRAA